MKRLLGQGALYSGTRLLEKCLAFLVIALVARWHGAELLGLFFYCFSLVSLLIPLMDVGYEKVMIRYWYKDEAGRGRLLGTLIRAKFISGVLALLIALGVHLLIRGDMEGGIGVLLAFVSIYSDQWAGLFRRIGQVQNRILGDLIIPPFTRLGILLLVSLLMIEHASALGLLGSYAICCVLGCLSSAYTLRWVKPVRVPRSMKAITGLWREGYAFSLTHMFVMFSLFVDSVMLTWISLEEVGYYNAAYRMVLVVAGLSYGACHVLFPVFSRAKEQDGHMGWAVLKKTGVVYLGAFGGLMFMTMLTASWVVGLAYGSSFQPTANVLQLLAPLILISAVTCLVGHWLEAIGLQRRVVVITGCAAGFNILANLILIPVYGMYGAAVTTILTELVVLMIQAGMIRRVYVKDQKTKEAGICQTPAMV